jgi:hypothetical protein
MSDKELGFSIKILGTDEEVGKLGKLESQLKSLAMQRAGLNKAVKDGTITSEEYGQQIADINLKTQSLKGSKRELERSIEVENELLSEQGGSYNQLSSELNNLRQQYRNMSEEERESAEGTEILEKIDSIDTELKDIDASMGQYQRNVGNYGSSFEAVGGQLGKVSPLFGQAQQQFNQFNNVLIVVKDSLFGQTAAQDAATVAAQGGAVSQKALTASTTATTTATNSQSKALKFLRAALIATGVGALLVFLGSLVAALSSTQRGMDSVNSVLRPLSALFQRLFGVVQDIGLSVFDKLNNAIENPKETLANLGEAIKTNLINRIVAVPNLFKSAFQLATSLFSAFGSKIKVLAADIPLIGKGIDKELAQKQYEEATQSIVNNSKDMANAAIQATTGIENGIEKIKDAAKSTANFVSESFQAGSKLHEMQVRIEKEENKLIVSREKLNALYQEQRLLAQDQNATDAERIASLNKAQAAQNQLLKEEQAFIDLKIEKKKLENSLNDTSRDDEKELQQLIAERVRAEAQAARKSSTLVSLRSGIIKRQRAEELKIIEDNNAKIANLIADLAEKEIATLEENTDEKILLIDQIKEYKTLQLREQLANEVISEREAKRQIIEIEEDAAQSQLNTVRNQHVELLVLRGKLAEDLAEVAALEQTGLRAAQKESIEKQLEEVDNRNEELKLKAQKLQTELAEKAGDLKEQDGSWVTELFGVEGEQAESIKSQLGNLANTLYQGFFQMKEQQLQKNLNRELKMIEKQQNSALDASNSRFDQEKRLLQHKLSEGEISQEEYNERLAAMETNLSGEKERINEKYAAKEDALKRKAFEKEKELALTKAAIDGALAVIKAYATLDPISASIYAGTVAFTTGFQIAQIAASEYGLGGLLNGPSHAQGGIPIVAEGGEGMINKRSMASNDVLSLYGTPLEIASALNSYKGFGKPFGMGGQVPYPSAPPNRSALSMGYQGLTAREMDQIASRIISGINDKRVILVQGDRDDFDRENSIVKQAQKW